MEFDNLSYEKDYQKIFNILMLYNIETYRKNPQMQFFPFKQCKDESWSLEHIHAQNSEGLPKDDNKVLIKWMEENVITLKKFRMKLEKDSEQDKRSQEIVERFGLRMDKFNIVHFGSMGVANGLMYIIDTAQLLRDKHIGDVNFVFVGDGATLPKLQAEVQKKGLNNVQFLGSHKMSVVSEIVNCCDASITSFLDLPILYTNSPNKLFDSLSAGKPIIVNSAGWTKDLVEKENCGCYVDPHQPQDFVDKIMKMKDNEELLSIWGKNARRLSIEVFDRVKLSKQMAEVVEKYGSNV